MKIAIVDHRASAGGVSRFITALTESLARNYKDLELGLFICQETIERDSLNKVFKEYKNIKFFPFASSDNYTIPREAEEKSKNIFVEKLKKLIKKSKTIHRIIFKINTFIKEKILKKSKRWYKFALNDETISKLNDFDVVYFAWPYFIKPVDLKALIVATFHDFNYMHDFVGNFNIDMEKIIKKQTPAWIEKTKIAVTSTKFIQNEMEKYYPSEIKNKKVVFLAPFSITKPSEEFIKKVLVKFNLPNEYIIYSGGVSRHKNITNLLKAISILKNQKNPTPLIITGISTDYIGKDVSFFSEDDPIHGINNAVKEEKLKINSDIYPLGYVSDEEVDALTKNAKTVISPSLYEAGCGPALDAWQLGTPVAFSNIPPFLEQLDFLKTKAWVFDPHSPKDMAKIITEALNNPEKSQQMVKESKEAIDKYTWDNVAEGYYKVFEEAIKEKR